MTKFTKIRKMLFLSRVVCKLENTTNIFVWDSDILTIKQKEGEKK